MKSGIACLLFLYGLIALDGMLLPMFCLVKDVLWRNDRQQFWYHNNIQCHVLKRTIWRVVLEGLHYDIVFRTKHPLQLFGLMIDALQLAWRWHICGVRCKNWHCLTDNFPELSSNWCHHDAAVISLTKAGKRIGYRKCLDRIWQIVYKILTIIPIQSWPDRPHSRTESHLAAPYNNIPETPYFLRGFLPCRMNCRRYLDLSVRLYEPAF